MDNKVLIQSFYKEFFNQHDVESANRFVRGDYIQHNPGVGQGRQALKEAFAEKFKKDPDFALNIIRIVDDGEFAAVYLKKYDKLGNTQVRVVDLYRIEDGMLAEHWDVLQPV